LSAEAKKINEQINMTPVTIVGNNTSKPGVQEVNIKLIENFIKKFKNFIFYF
jgi:hypothetical protein